MIPTRFSPSGYPVPSARDLSALGLPTLAYTRPMLVDGQPAWGIFQADGRQIGAAPTRDIAIAAMIQHELEPASVH